ncbi:MAG: hypothetical protein FD122_2068 [Stygiobacter sp.]|nr:MAG: hypothetical protein FD122_2068 [Stygiobacter sp.]KAF0214326.1 MAG: hypothetical protein FD178_2501 [Ignavibacteria bacterium]
MKKVFFVLVMVTTFVSAQSVDLSNMLNHEYAFAEKAAHAATREAFLAFIADDGIIFRPHPVNGKEFLGKTKPNNGWLIWYPERAGISASGDIGYTTGPASFRKAKGDSADIWFGNFCTVWRKQKDNTWKFLIDFGISNEKPSFKIAPLKYELSENATAITVTELGEKSKIRLLEDEFNRTKNNLRMERYFSGSRFLVEGSAPIDGEINIAKFLIKKVNGSLNYNMIDGGISSANDFAYAYGTIKYSDLLTNTNCENYYLRVWQKQKDDWKITIEVWNEKPKD